MRADPVTEDERLRWVFGDVMYETVGFLIDEYGHASPLNVGLGLPQEMYMLLDLEY